MHFLTRALPVLILGAGALALLVLGTAFDSAAETAATNSASPAKPHWAAALAPWKAEEEHETADNSFCYVCHVNYDGEKLVKGHVSVGVGCETCHGMSYEHSEDEDNINPPDVMYPKATINAFCMDCHSKADVLANENHEDMFVDPEETCNDCHGEKHRLKVRTRRWDKLTGKLVWDDGVRMMEKKPAAGQ